MFAKVFHHKGSDGAGVRFCCTRLENFSVSIGRQEIFANVDLHIHCGQLTAIIGPNGAGKSTLLRALLGEIPHGGSIRYTSGDGRQAASPRIGYVPQYLRFDVSAPVSVGDLFMASLSERPVWFMPQGNLRERIVGDLTRVKAEGLIDRRLGALSGGELQRVLLALALDPLPELLILDEPVSGVDHNGLAIFYEILSRLREEEDMAILLVSHDLELVARHADQVVFMDRGVVTAGEPQKIFADSRTRAVFGRIQVPAGEEVRRWRPSTR